MTTKKCLCGEKLPYRRAHSCRKCWDKVTQYAKHIAALADQRVSINEFEDWFRDASRNAHQWGDSNVNDFVDAVESLFSERYFENLDERDLRSKLQQEARRFARPFVSTIVLRYDPGSR